MYCSECGKDVGAARFCRWCGAKQEEVDAGENILSEQAKTEEMTGELRQLGEEQPNVNEEPVSAQPQISAIDIAEKPLEANHIGSVSSVGEASSPAQAECETDPGSSPLVPPPPPPPFDQKIAINYEPDRNASALLKWKTSIGFSLLGLFVGFPVAVALIILFSMLISVGIAFLIGASGDLADAVVNALIMPVGASIWYVLTIIYAVKFYPSYFTGQPRLKSNRLISFSNLMFGNVIFGVLWNSSLTIKAKGSSHSVLVVLTALMLAYMVFGIGSVLVQGIILS